VPRCPFAILASINQNSLQANSGDGWGTGDDAALYGSRTKNQSGPAHGMMLASIEPGVPSPCVGRWMVDLKLTLCGRFVGLGSDVDAYRRRRWLRYSSPRRSENVRREVLRGRLHNDGRVRHLGRQYLS